jgi:O-antigen/teichoic acid export membrane protein
MEQNRVKRASTNMIWSIFNTVIGLFLPFVTQTCIIYILGVQYVGLNSLFASVLEVLNLTELGIGGAMLYSMYKPVAVGDDEKVCALLALYRKCYRIIGCIVLAAGFCILPFINHFISGDVPEDINVYILFAIYLFNSVISYFMFAYKSSVLYGHQEVDTVSLINMIVVIIKAVLQCSLLICMRNYYCFAIVIPLTTILQNMITGILVSVKYPQYCCKGNVSKDEFKEIKQQVMGMVFQKVSEVVVFSADNIVVSAFLGIYTLGIYSNYLFVYKALTKFAEAIQQALLPVVGNSIVLETKEKNYNVFNTLLLFYLWMASWLSICQLCLYQPFIRLWVGENHMFDDGIMICFVVYTYILVVVKHCAMYSYASGIMWQGRYALIASAMVNLVTNLIFVRWIGIKGVLLSTVFAIAFIRIPFQGRVICKYYFAKPRIWIGYVAKIFLHSVITVLVAGITYWICMQLPAKNDVIRIIERFGVCIVVPNLLLLICYYKTTSFQEVKKIVSKVIKKK